MDCTVYQTRDRLVLVPDCMRASVLVESLFGPMTACGTIDTDSLDIALSKQYDEALGADLYVTSSPDLVLRSSYRPTGTIDPPEGFRWKDGDWWSEQETTLMRDAASGSVVAKVLHAPNGGWKAYTNVHRDAVFRGEAVCISRAAAIQYLTLWARLHVAALLRETAGGGADVARSVSRDQSSRADTIAATAVSIVAGS